MYMVSLRHAAPYPKRGSKTQWQSGNDTRYYSRASHLNHLLCSYFRVLQPGEAWLQALRLPRQQGRRLGGRVRRPVLQERLLQDVQLPVRRRPDKVTSEASSKMCLP